ncbi:MAG: hypothetical protein HF978_19770 [Desulfobacteraceae bacterium]|nr:hypothetical protein [Desulfobacteraceae bacterium]MBC2757788.1 hypothetical protein [Desulfobacteraceae bacterium]MBC2763853.1 hypothetical protein [ANME-2 cluster archaeon]
MSDNLHELESFIENWPDSPEQNKQTFIRLKKSLESKPGVILEFIPRPEVTYSLRAKHENQTGKPLFAMMDVIEDSPRWLSVCFYGELINDPDESGDYVPEGLLGEDAICFDLEEFDEDAIRYVETRLDEAYTSASKA